MHVYAMPLALLALPIYLTIGVELWRRSHSFRDTFCEVGYVEGMILTAILWPILLPMFALFAFLSWLFWKL